MLESFEDHVITIEGPKLESGKYSRWGKIGFVGGLVAVLIWVTIVVMYYNRVFSPSLLLDGLVVVLAPASFGLIRYTEYISERRGLSEWKLQLKDAAESALEKMQPLNFPVRYSGDHQAEMRTFAVRDGDKVVLRAIPNDKWWGRNKACAPVLRLLWEIEFPEWSPRMSDGWGEIRKRVNSGEGRTFRLVPYAAEFLCDNPDDPIWSHGVDPTTVRRDRF